jgi:ketosteroid isomerase-like protein
MDRGGSAYIFLALLLLTPFFGALAGCGQSSADQVAAEQREGDDSDVATSSVVSEPADAADVVREFLTAIKTGDETRSNDLLTPLARQKTAEMDMAVAPIGSDSASFTVGEVELPEEGGGELAHVESTWTDIDDDGQPHTDDILWVLRHEDNGWRIAGMATKVFDDQPPLLLNFEDPTDMRRKQQLAEAEMERRAREAAANVPEESDDAHQTEATAALSSPTQRQATKAARPNRNK